ncbi:trypsin-like peptidase domain-containing protein [Novosphingobium album (ex Liu et al. 2023)]|nr:trypsin-like peptidase domain-containing protein [Novosphingobium album (ex Liu et al. 2023)]
MLKGHPELNQDPRLRAMILPMFRFDPNSPEERPFGLGTAFRIDPWANCATAFHVIEDMLTLKKSALALRHDVRFAALEIEGIVYGAAPLPKDAWRPLTGFYAEAGKTEPALLHEKAQIRNLTEIACLNIGRSHRSSPMPYLPLALTSEPPRVGDIVTGYGFAGLDVAKDGKGEDRPMAQYLYQSTGEVLEIIPADASSTMPWPRLRVSAEWPSGMSGGPVMNAAGNVIGVISRGWTGEADSTATHFAGWDVSRRTFGTIDPFAPRRFRAFAAIDAESNLRFAAQDAEEARAFASKEGLEVRAVSFSPDTGEWLSL